MQTNHNINNRNNSTQIITETPNSENDEIFRSSLQMIQNNTTPPSYIPNVNTTQALPQPNSSTETFTNTTTTTTTTTQPHLSNEGAKAYEEHKNAYGNMNEKTKIKKNKENDYNKETNNNNNENNNDIEQAVDDARRVGNNFRERAEQMERIAGAHEANAENFANIQANIPISRIQFFIDAALNFINAHPVITIGITFGVGYFLIRNIRNSANNTSIIPTNIFNLGSQEQHTRTVWQVLFQPNNNQPQTVLSFAITIYNRGTQAILDVGTVGGILAILRRAFRR